jgi:hypothetical protein
MVGWDAVTAPQGQAISLAPDWTKSYTELFELEKK